MPADDHTHGDNRTPQLYHSTTDQPTATNYSEPPAPPETASSNEAGGVSTCHSMRVTWHLLLQVVSRLLKTHTDRDACGTRPPARPRTPGPWNPEVDKEMQCDPPPRIICPKERESEISVQHGLPLWAERNGGYCSRQPSPSPTWGSRFVGTRDVGPWVAEPKPLNKTPFAGNPCPDMRYLPTCMRPVLLAGLGFWGLANIQEAV